MTDIVDIFGRRKNKHLYFIHILWSKISCPNVNMSCYAYDQVFHSIRLHISCCFRYIGHQTYRGDDLHLSRSCDASITWTVDSPDPIFYWWSFGTEALSQTIFGDICIRICLGTTLAFYRLRNVIGQPFDTLCA